MTEEIIINGVDVAGCKHFKKVYGGIICNSREYCVEQKDCYYKQLQRLQTALKEIKEIKEMVTRHYYQSKKELVQNYDLLNCFMQKIEDKCNEVIR